MRIQQLRSKSVARRCLMIGWSLALMSFILSCASESTTETEKNVIGAQVSAVIENEATGAVGTIVADDRPNSEQKPRVAPKPKAKSVIKPTFTPIPASSPIPLPSGPKLLKFVKNVEVTPEETIDIIGAFCRINYVPASDNFLVTFGGTSKEKHTQGYGYKWYTDQMEFTGKGGLFENRGTDTASVMIDNTYYFLTDGGKDIWALKKYDPSDWTLLGETLISRDPNKEPGNDFMLAEVNGMLDVAGLYVSEAKGYIDQHKLDPYQGEATSHRFFSQNLELLDNRILNDAPHINASSMVFVDGIYNFVTSTAFFGDLIVMQYDQNWKYLVEIIPLKMVLV